MSGNKEKFEKVMSQGHSAAWEQDWKKAASLYRQALEEFPDNPKAMNSLGLACYEQKNYKDALTYYQQAAKLMPDDPMPLERISELLHLTGNTSKAAEIYMRSAELYIKNREVDKALSVWQKVLSLQPDHLMARSRLALVYERLGRKGDAVREFLSIASIYQNAGEVQRAMQAVAHAQRLIPESVDVKQALAMLNAGRSLPRPTAQMITESLSVEGELQPEPEDVGLDPVVETCQKALAQLAELVFEQFDTEQPEQASRKGLQSIMKGTGFFGSKQIDQTKIMMHLRDAVNLQSLQQDKQLGQQALGELERAVDAGLDHAAVYFDMGYLYFGSSRFESAVRSLQKALNHEDYTFGTRLLLGQTLLQLGRTKEAANELLEALKLADLEMVPAERADELSMLYDPIIDNYSRAQESESTKRVCENILSLLRKPGWRGNLKRARQQFQGESDGTVLTPLADMLIQAPSSQLVDSMARIQQLNQAGKPRAAMEEAYYALQHAPTYLPLHIQMGEMLFQQNQIMAAVEKFKMIARCFHIRGDSGRAINLLQRVVGISAMDVDARSQLIDLLTSHGKMEEVVNEYMRLADVYYNLADLAKTHETLQLAMRVAQQANLGREARVKVLLRIADIDLQSLDWKQALKSYEQIRNLKPEDAQIRKTMIDLYFRFGQGDQGVSEMKSFVAILTQQKQTDRALEFIGLMEEEHPDQPAILRLAADLYRQAGQTDQAIKKLDAAGELYLQNGNSSAAKETIMAILSLNPPNAADYQHLLAQISSKSV